ncbi:MAG TPA: hypothetical protein VK611_22000 [Acidimicrobiales bacterium]|nr:hypothetical protein [Acidimicrobiales bacterium]
MFVVVRVLAVLLGTGVVLAMLASAVKTVVMPRAEPAQLTRWVFVGVRKPFDVRLRKLGEWHDADRLMARYAPFALVMLPGVWMAILVFGFVPIYWGLGLGWRDAVMQSGSSALTLGFATDTHGSYLATTFVEATLGLGLIALLISFLPSIYGQFSHREVLVSQLDTWAGTPPSPVGLFRRANTIGWMGQLDDFWADWERWFAEIEESHTSFQALPFFRSTRPQRSWITAAGAVLDGAALRASTLDLPPSWRAQLCLRSGYLALRGIASTFDIAYDDAPDPSDPISITRDEYDEVVDELVALGIAVKPDRDQAWRDFAGWRVNYDLPLLALCGLVMAPVAPWSSDRSVNYRVRVVTMPRRRNGRPPGTPS